jgi:hypothetical protein
MDMDNNKVSIKFQIDKLKSNINKIVLVNKD